MIPQTLSPWLKNALTFDPNRNVFFGDPNGNRNSDLEQTPERSENGRWHLVRNDGFMILAIIYDVKNVSCFKKIWCCHHLGTNLPSFLVDLSAEFPEKMPFFEPVLHTIRSQ